MGRFRLALERVWEGMPHDLGDGTRTQRAGTVLVAGRLSFLTVSVGDRRGSVLLEE